MRNERFRKFLEEVPQETKIFVKHYAAIIHRIHNILEAKGYTQKDLAEKMDKVPSEISKWLNSCNEHNFTLRSISKLEAILGETIVNVATTPITKMRTLTAHKTFVATTPPQFTKAFEIRPLANLEESVSLVS